MDQNIKRQYIRALKKVNILNPHYKAAKAILGLLTYYSNGSFDDKEFNIDGLDNHKKADALFGILNRYTVCNKCHDMFFDEEYYVFTRFDIPKEICETIKRKYIKELKRFNIKNKGAKQREKQYKQDEINRINDNLDKLL